MGHNLGLDHDPASQDEGGYSHYRFGQGWSRWSDFYRIGSIMAYADQRELFSSPNNQMRDENTGRMYTMGDGTTNAVRALNLVRLDYSQIRPRVSGNPSAFGSSASSSGSMPNPSRPPKRSERCMLPMHHH